MLSGSEKQSERAICLRHCRQFPAVRSERGQSAGDRDHPLPRPRVTPLTLVPLLVLIKLPEHDEDVLVLMRHQNHASKSRGSAGLTLFNSQSVNTKKEQTDTKQAQMILSYCPVRKLLTIHVFLVQPFFLPIKIINIVIFFSSP